MIGRFARPGVYRELLVSRDFYMTASAGTLAAASWLLGGGSESPALYAAVPAFLSAALTGGPIVWGAIRGLFNREVNVDELVSLAIVASMLQGDFLAAAVVAFVMTVGSLVEKATSESARNAIRALIRLSPKTATVITGGAEREIPVEEVAPGDTILIRPGDQVPVDALVLTGESSIDESALTGEPMPRHKKPGEMVFAGTLNHSGVLTVKAEKVGRDTTFGKIVALVTEAEQHRPRSVRVIDRYAQWFTPLILFVAAVTWAVTQDLNRAVTVLIVGCPCALILAAPTATVAALGRSARAGVLVKGGEFLEKMTEIRAVYFDKTGTLTQGAPKVEEIFCMDGISEGELLSMAAGAEKNAAHPMARAVLKAAHYAKVTIPAARNTLQKIGLGVSALVEGALVEVGSVYAGADTAAFPPILLDRMKAAMARGATPLLVSRNQEPMGLMNVSDPIRSISARAVARFRELGISRLGILSGDHREAATRVARAVGIEEVHSGLTPEDKAAAVIRCREEGFPVMFVGDGINDAPALASSHVGVAMGAGGTEAALETADIALIHDDISKLPWLISLSRRMTVVIRINVAFGLAFNTLAVIAGGMGWLSPVEAALVHNIGSILVVMTAASLALYPEPAPESP